MSDFHPLPPLGGQPPIDEAFASVVSPDGKGPMNLAPEELIAMTNEELEAAGLRRGETPMTTVEARKAIESEAPFEPLIRALAHDQINGYLEFRHEKPDHDEFPQLSLWGTDHSTMHAVLAAPVMPDYEKNMLSFTGGFREMRVATGGEAVFALGVTLEGYMALMDPAEAGVENAAQVPGAKQCVIAMIALTHEDQEVLVTVSLPIEVDDDGVITTVDEMATATVNGLEQYGHSHETGGSQVANILLNSYKAIKELEAEGS